MIRRAFASELKVMPGQCRAQHPAGHDPDEHRRERTEHGKHARALTRRATERKRPKCLARAAVRQPGVQPKAAVANRAIQQGTGKIDSGPDLA